MKVVQLLLDGYNSTNKISNIYSHDLLSEFKCRTISTLLKGDRLASPNMWGRTLYGSNFSQGKGYNPRKSDKWNADNQGYSDSMDHSNWIWNELPNDVDVLAIPYYLIKQIESSDLVSTDNTRLILYDYRNPEYQICSKDNNRTIVHRENNTVYHELCDIFDNGNIDYPDFESLKIESQSVWDCQMNLSNFILKLHDIIAPVITTRLNDNNKFISNVIQNNLSSNDNQYTFIGITDTDSLYHYCLPYNDLFSVLHNDVDSIIKLVLDKIDPDILIIHGDHNMDDTPRLRRRKKNKFEYYYNNSAGLCHQPYYNKFPMYCDHGKLVGGDIYYKNEYENLINKLSTDSPDYNKSFVEYLKEWLVNEVF